MIALPPWWAGGAKVTVAFKSVGTAVTESGADGSSPRAVQAASLPLYKPAHDQYHGPEPVTGLAVPLSHRLSVGAVVKLPPFELPQLPFTGLMSAPVQALTSAVASTEPRPDTGS